MGNAKAGRFRCECGEWEVEVEWKTKSCAQDPLLVGGYRERAGRAAAASAADEAELVPSKKMGTVWLMDR